MTQLGSPSAGELDHSEPEPLRQGNEPTSRGIVTEKRLRIFRILRILRLLGEGVPTWLQQQRAAKSLPGRSTPRARSEPCAESAITSLTAPTPPLTSPSSANMVTTTRLSCLGLPSRCSQRCSLRSPTAKVFS
ncbi:hypothetical protein SBRY_50323 [Actinacidiphila bryophytorum]|uniref:Uncharacterized protein n=1 Tax=Actinacidiphila bryophytorum TaxID=1436133 RepID=A0A9W4MJA8_9ACTN|nr:hypothetical protein SBRY_50323 [Actinacidiphila bryophytorum]